jgi:hypothetical protein
LDKVMELSLFVIKSRLQQLTVCNLIYLSCGTATGVTNTSLWEITDPRSRIFPDRGLLEELVLVQFVDIFWWRCYKVPNLYPEGSHSSSK